MRNPVRGIDRRSPLAKRRGAPAASARTIFSVTVGALTSFNLPLNVASNGVAGEPAKLVLLPELAPESSPTQANVGTDGADDPATAFLLTTVGATAISIPAGIALADFKLGVIINNGALSNIVFSDPFPVDTVLPTVPAATFGDGGGAAMSTSITIDKATTTNGLRRSVWAAGTNPSNAAIKSGTGTGIVLTSTATAAAGTPVTGNLATGAGTFQVTVYAQDAFGNEVYYTHPANVVVAAATDPRLSESGVLYWFASDDTTRSGTDVTLLNDKRGGFDLNTKPAAFSFIQQASAGAVLQFAATRVLQTSNNVAGNRKMINHMLGGGSNGIRAFMVLDANTISTADTVWFCETDRVDFNQAIWFATRVLSGTVRITGGGKRFSDAYGISANTGLSQAALGLCILEFLITQTTWEAFVNGTSIGTGAVTAANLPNPGTCRTTIGALATDVASAAPAVGNFREIYVTTNQDATVRGNIITALKTQYGIP